MNATDQIPTLPALRTLGNLADVRPHAKQPHDTLATLSELPHQITTRYSSFW